MKAKLKSKAKKTLKAKPAAKRKAKSKTKIKAKKKTAAKKKPKSKKKASKLNTRIGQKATTSQAKKNTAPKFQEKSAFFSTTEKDPAHRPGHRKMNLKDQLAKQSGDTNQPQNQSAMNNMSRANRIQRQSAANRRIITGAALGKTGRITIKD